MKKNFLSFTFFIVIFFSFQTIFAQEKIAFVDLNYVYSNSKIGKKINKEISNKQKSINKEFQEFQKKLDDEKKSLLAQKNVLSEDEYKKKILKLENNLINYNEQISKKNKDLIDFRNKSKNDFALNLRSTLEKYAKENKVSMILRKDQLLLGENSLDITKEILELFNKS
jgi:Skp family chaperone for outer membrane proteins|tara:strand:+ start:85 stop:591 length:507 start_codon:yes stop_codon:yes gene_type:complete